MTTVVTTTNQSLVLRYPDSCIMFNMTQCSRVKKTSSGAEDFDEDLSDHWENDDELHLIIRLLDDGGYPWILSHYGSREIIKAPLVIPIRGVDVEGKRVSILLRDFSNRGENCIKRKFYLEFPSAVEADIFQYSHNRMLDAYKMELKEGMVSSSCSASSNSGKEENGGVKCKKRKKNNNNEKENQPPKKRYHVSCEKKEKKDDGSGSYEEKNGEEVDDSENEEVEYERTVQQFEAGDDHDFLDDCFPETQDPYFDDE